MRPMASVNKDVYAKYIRTGALEVDGAVMARSGVVATWTKDSKYEPNALVFRAGNLWRANAAIAARTPFEEGSHGPTWTRLNTKNTVYDMAETGMGFGRMHIWNNRVIMVGANAGHIHNFGGAAGGVPREVQPYSGDAPSEWSKVHDTCANFIGLGTDGCLYVAGSNASKLLLGSGPNTNVAHYVRLEHPRLYGPGKAVLNFWATDVDAQGESTAVTVVAVVDDNGTNTILAWGHNIRGNGRASPPDAPILIAEGHSIRSCDVLGNVVMFVRDDGTVWWYGDDLSIDGGNSAFVQAAVPEAADVRIGFETNVGYCAFVLLSTGEVMSVGASHGGSLGDGVDIDGRRGSFDYVMTGPDARLSNVAEIRTAGVALVALDTRGRLFVTGLNYCGYWGTGESTAAPAAWATQKWTDVDQMWVYRAPYGHARLIFHRVGRPHYLCAGDNTCFALGAVSGSETSLKVAQRVLLPKGEAIIKLKFLGADTKTAQRLGLQVLTASGRIFACGRLGTPILGSADYLQWLTPIVGFS